MSFYRHRHPTSAAAAPHFSSYRTAEELTEQLEADALLHHHHHRHHQHHSLHNESQLTKKKDAVSSSSSLLLPSHELPSAFSTSWNAADIIALYLRRQRHAIMHGDVVLEEGEERERTVRGSTHSSSVGSSDRLLASYSPKLLLLGENAVVRELATMLRTAHEEGDSEASGVGAHDTSGDHQTSRSTFSGASLLRPSPEVFTMPDAVDDGLTALRAELCRWCDVILLCYHVSDPSSFVHVQEEVIPFVLEACAGEEAYDEEVEEWLSSKHSSGGTAASASFAAYGWPSALPPPLIIVGLGAEARLSRDTDLQAPWITNADVLAVAAEAGVQRVVELYSHSTRHLHILLQHCCTLREVGYESLPSPAAQGRRAALKEFGLHALLRAPPPLLELHPGTRSLHVVLPPRVPSVPDSRSEAGDGDGVYCLYSVSDVAAPHTAASASSSPSLEVPASGVLTYEAIFSAYTRATGRPAQHAAGIVVSAWTTVPYLFPSETVQQCLPAPTAAPFGYVDVVQRCCRVTVPAAARGLRTSSSGGNGGSGVSRVRCAIGDAVSYVEVPAASCLRDRRPGPAAAAAVSLVCVPLDDGAPYLTSASASGREVRSTAWLPWPSTRPAPSAPRQLQVVVEEEEGEEARAQGKRASPASAAATFTIPPVLPAPVVDYNAQQRCVRLHVPGYRADQVEVRYTLDGTVPTSAHGHVYKEAVLLDQQELVSSPACVSPSGVVHIRAVAFPKLYFASRMAEAHVDVSSSNGADAASVQQPLLQDDEQLLSTPHRQWGSPRRSPGTSSLLTSQRSKHSHYHQQQRQRQQKSPSFSHQHSPSYMNGSSPRRAPAAHPPQRHPSARRFSAGSSFTGSDGVAVASDTVTTRSAQLRQAFNAGLYTPPRHPFSQGEGFTPSPRRQGRSGAR